MKIIRNFEQWKTGEYGSQPRYSITLEVKQDDSSLYVFRNINGLATYGAWIEAKNIVDAQFLEKLNIDYVVEDNKVIPMGLVNFFGGNYVQASLPIVFNTIEEQLQYKNIVEQLEKAVKYQYVAKELRDKCSIQDYTEETEL